MPSCSMCRSPSCRYGRVSALIDITVIFVCYVLGLMLWAATLTQFDTALSAAVLIIFTVLVIVGYPLIFETATRGRSVGKIVMGLRVVSDDGGPERFRQVLFRALASVVEIWMFFGSPAVICSMVSPKAKRIGDIFAGTVVVSERGPRLAPPPVMPPSLAWWASSLQLSGLSPGQAEVARQFLSRASQLDRQLRQQMAYRIAGDVVARIAPPPPPGRPAGAGARGRPRRTAPPRTGARCALAGGRTALPALLAGPHARRLPAEPLAPATAPAASTAVPLAGSPGGLQERDRGPSSGGSANVPTAFAAKQAPSRLIQRARRRCAAITATSATNSAHPHSGTAMPPRRFAVKNERAMTTKATTGAP